MNDIDFVVTWVDGNDPNWQKEKNRYLDMNVEKHGGRDNRFRDWGLLKYWFRGVEENANWVNKIHFITWGHIPEWLNVNHTKLNIITHDDYIPKEFLPTFNSNVIEIFLHRIEELAEKFVLFNDDMYIINRVMPEDFFEGDIPKDEALLEAVICQNPDDKFGHILLNNSSVINKYYNKKTVQKERRRQFYSLLYKQALIRNILLTPMEYFSGFRDLHLPSSHTKAIFEEVWSCEREVLLKTAGHRFRSIEDINHWLFKNWRCCKGDFVPRNVNWGRYFEIGRDKDIPMIIDKKNCKVVCVNDGVNDNCFDNEKKKLIEAFEKIYPQKSTYEI